MPNKCPDRISPITRRKFIGAAGAAAATFLAGTAEAETPGPSGAGNQLIRIDTHTHFYDPSRDEGVPWPSKTDPFLYRTILPRHYKALPLPNPIHGTVVVEASPWVEDNQWILNIAAHDPFIVGLVGNLPLGDKSFPEHLKRFSKNPLFRGIRIGQDKMRKALSDRATGRQVNRMADLDLCVDLLIGPGELPLAADFAKKFPRLRIILDHVANVKIDSSTPPSDWQSGMKKLANERLVYCKVSALVEGTGRSQGDAPSNVEFYRPVLDIVYEAFGQDRLLYGSNWPVSERFAPCATVQKIVEDYFSEKGSPAMAKFFSINASKAYKWVRRA